MSTIRERLSNALVEGAFERSVDAAELDRRLAALPPDTPGRDLARSVVLSARRRESLLLWLGFRLRPRHNRL
jgi:hypothetical protein